MAAITKQQLKERIQQAFDMFSNVEVEPANAREQQAQKIADAIELYVVGRETIVTGTSASGGPVTGTGIIQPN